MQLCEFVVAPIFSRFFGVPQLVASNGKGIQAMQTTTSDGNFLVATRGLRGLTSIFSFYVTAVENPLFHPPPPPSNLGRLHYNRRCCCFAVFITSIYNDLCVYLYAD